MPRLPPVEKSPQTRLRATFWPGVGYSHSTFDQSHSSSSATSWARPVRVPCPISDRAIRMITVSSGFTTTQALTSGGRAWACASRPSGMWNPNESPAAAELTRNDRRFIRGISFMTASSSRARGSGVDCRADLLVGAAPADVGDVGVDVGVGRLCLVLEKRRHRHDHAGLAIAALRHVVIEPDLLHLVKDPVLGEAFDRGDLLTFSFADRQRARAHCLTIDVNRACAALRDAAAILGAGEADLFP